MLKLMLVVLKICFQIAAVVGGKRGQIIGGISYLVFMATMNIGLFAMFYIATDYYTSQFDSVLFTFTVAAVVQHAVMWLYGRTITEKEIMEYTDQLLTYSEKFMKLSGEKA